ncbi:ABC transporter permease [Amycolatopsis circi]|uniref:ABC transporter permease n=1 Tax=Amycolatopsis circi TaxID=871959 RepID=UPI000E23113D|nr:ABC transporter permease subunit [Amycolatopsis circi]
MIIQVASAELGQLRRRVALWAAGAVWLVQIVVFAYLVQYLTYRKEAAKPDHGKAETLIHTLVPDGLAYYNASLYPLYGSAIALIIGALVGGGDYRWRTMTTLLTQRPDRRTVVLGKLASLATVMAVLVVMSFVVSAVCATAVAAAEGRSQQWPLIGDLVASFGACWLSVLAFAGLGFTLAFVFRSVAAALAIGLVWTLALESLLAGLAATFEGLKPLRAILIGPNSGVLAHALGAAVQGQGGPLGVTDIAVPIAATIVLVGYVLATVVVSMVVLNRRDVI